MRTRKAVLFGLAGLASIASLHAEEEMAMMMGGEKLGKDMEHFGRDMEKMFKGLGEGMEKSFGDKGSGIRL